MSITGHHNEYFYPGKYIVKINGLICLLMVLVCSWSSAQHPENYLQPTAMKKDLVWLQRKILLYHPACIDSVRYDSVNAAFQTAFYEVEKPMQELSFLLLLRRTLGSLRCGHSTALPSKSFYRYYGKARPRPFFPLQVLSLPGNCVVRFNGSDDSKIKIGDRISYINQESMEDLQNELLQILPSDGYHQSFRHHHLSLNFPSYYLFLRGPYYYFETSLTDTSGRSKNKTLSLRSQTKTVSKPRANRSVHVLLSDGKDRDYATLKSNPAMACLRLGNFNGKTGWYRKVFQKIQRTGVKNLILDLRGNPGGSLHEANALLSYLLPDTFSMKFVRRSGRIHFNGHGNLGIKSLLSMLQFRWLPKKRKGSGGTTWRQGETIITRYCFEPEKPLNYTGRLLVLMDGGTFSSAAYVSAQLRKAERAVLAGDESGGAARGCNAILIPTLTLAETRLRITMPLYFLDHEIIDPAFRGLCPEIPLPAPDPAQKLNGIDSELEFLAKHFKFIPDLR